MPRPPAELRGPVEVPTCIGCGARTRFAACAAGCVDVPLDLVEVAQLEAFARAVEAAEARAARLRAAAGEAAAAADGAAWTRVRQHAGAAVRTPSPAADPARVEVVPAWGCPACGRVDAPRDCIGVCVRRPVAMCDARALRDLERRLGAARGEDARLAPVVRLVASVTPRAGAEEATRAALAERARAALGERDG